MNKKIIFSLLVALTARSAQPMLQLYNQKKSGCNVPIVRTPAFKQSRAPRIAIEQPLSIDLEEWREQQAQKTMTTIGELTIFMGKDTWLDQITNNDRALIKLHCSDDQRLILFLLALPNEILISKIFDHEICENDEEMKKDFYSRPLGKALEWYALMEEKYKDKTINFANAISFPELYCLSPTTVIECTNMINYFEGNPTTPYIIGSQQEKALSLLPIVCKNNEALIDKRFLVKPYSLLKFMLNDLYNPATHKFLIPLAALASAAFVTYVTKMSNANIPFFRGTGATMLFYTPVVYCAFSVRSFIDYRVQKKDGSLPAHYYKTINQLGK